MDVHSLLDFPCDSLWLPINHGKTFRTDWVSCGVAMVVDVGWGPMMLLEPVPKVLLDPSIYSSGKCIFGHLNL